MKIHKMDQRSDEWFDIRKGKLTASNAQAIGANGKGLETLVYQLLAEKYSNNKEHYTNKDMERGIELEPLARDTYEIEQSKVKEVGFIELDEFVGCSPDGLVSKDGGIEIKCPNDAGFFKLLVNGRGAIESKYLWQVQMTLYITKRSWWDLVFYNPNFNQNILIFRITPVMFQSEKLMLGIETGKNLIKKLNKKYEKIYTKI